MGVKGVVLLGAGAFALFVISDARAAETLVVKPSDESVTASTTLQADDDLAFAGSSGVAYQVEAELRYASPAGGATPDIKFALGEDTTLRGYYTLLGSPLTSEVGTQTLGDVDTDSTNGRGTLLSGGDRVAYLRGTYISGGGTLTLYWAQNTSDANPTILRAGSTLRVTPTGEASGSGASGATVLDDLDDVDTTGALDGTVLKYDEASSTWLVATDSTGEGSSVVTLSAGDRERLDLSWWGVWALVGLVLVLMIAPMFLRLLDIRQGMGGRFERG